MHEDVCDGSIVEATSHDIVDDFGKESRKTILGEVDVLLWRIEVSGKVHIDALLHLIGEGASTEVAINMLDATKI